MRREARIVSGSAAPPDEPVLTVDGAWGLPGLCLSHWPGHTTPAPLRHDLSTGCALAFARLAPDEQERWARGARLALNNHYDTDGTCALFAVTRPELALPRSAALLGAARAGDFFQLPDEDALAVDALVGGLTDSERSPLAAELAGRGDLERWQLATDHLLEQLPAILDGERAPYRALWEPVLLDTRADLSDLARCARHDDEARDWTTWTAPAHTRGARDPSALIRPGRHALFGSTDRDRVLVLGAEDGGLTCRLILSTLSWFDLVTLRKPARPDLGALAARLNAREGTAPEDEAAWRSQTGASPELWFGEVSQPQFAEYNEALRPSRLSARELQAEFERALQSD